MGRDVSIDVSLANIWRSWYLFRSGKKRTWEIDIFTYNLEANLFQLHTELVRGEYKHGPYKSFSLTDTKKRIISVASIRDRIVHRLLYDYLVSKFDRTFIYDAWSCRKGKGLMGAILRTQQLLTKYHFAYVWRGDITKFFDNVNQSVLKTLLSRRINDPLALQLINTIIDSYYSYFPGVGIPIGNLTSQVFTNIYFHEFDRYVVHEIKPLAYVRYGDDFIVIMSNKTNLETCRQDLLLFLNQTLRLKIHTRNNIIIPVRNGVHFLGCDIYPYGRRLQKRMYKRISQRLSVKNASSYRALLIAHSKQSIVNWIDWQILDIVNNT